MEFKNKVRARSALMAGAVALAVTFAVVTPASALTSSQSCAGTSVTILSGNTGGSNSIAQTSNQSGACATVSHAAYTNQYGSIAYTARGGYSSAHDIIRRTFFGTMKESHHYHNGNARGVIVHY